MIYRQKVVDVVSRNAIKYRTFIPLEGYEEHLEMILRKREKELYNRRFLSEVEKEIINYKFRFT